ncbi:armadillo-type protein [Circinella umbellata]|nr:armadillo-type protein [Circinella umbellata]
MATQEERIAYYTTLCEQLYNPKSSGERDQVQKMLEYSFPTFSGETGSGIASQSQQQPPPPGMENSPTFAIVTPTDTASALRILLEGSPNPLVQTFCLSRLKQLILAQFSIFERETKLQLRTFLLEYCFMHPDLEPFVISQIAGVIASLTRFGWADMEEYRNIHKDIQQFLQASMDHRIVGLQMLAILIQDIQTSGTNTPVRSAQYRKAAAAFRDTQLFNIFETSFETLSGLLQRNIPFDKPGQEDRLKDAVITVLLKCLSYDFAGTNLDDAGEDFGVVQIPSSWRPMFEDENFVPTLFNAYRELQPPLSSKVMECLVQVASVRKALFSGDAERSKFVLNMMQGVRDIIFTGQGMNDTNNYNEFCRLLYRFRATAPLNEMAEKPGYVDWISLIADFSLKAVQSWKWAPETTHYLLGFWSRIIQSMTHYQQLNDSIVQKIKSITIELTRTYITTNIESVPTRMEEMLDDPLENEESLIESLVMLGHIARCKYEQSSAALVAIFDPIALQYQELITQAASGMTGGDSFKEALEVIETKFAWLVYIIAAFIGTRPAFLSSEELDSVDGQLTTKVLQLMDVNQALQNQHGSAFLNQKLDMAFVYFFMQFRKSYIGETNGKSVYTKLAELFGISDQILMIDVIMRKIVNNLQCWGHNEVVIRRTLELFNELATGYSAVKNLRKIETTRLVLQNHMSPEFAFFESSKHQQNRMLYYQVLCKVLFSEDNNEREFHAFMKPFESRLQQIEMLDSVEQFRQEPVRRALQDIFRDLRGFIQPIQTRRHYLMFFDWFYPDYMPILLRALEAWSPDPAANTLLKFFADFVFNRSQRLNFPISSPNSILVFRDTSRVISTFGRHISERQVTNESEKYPYKYKGISICFNILSRCLGGRYINFGVFWLYQDKAIDEAFHMMFQLMLSIPLDDLMGFPKLARAFITLLDDFAQEQLTALPTLEPNTFLYLMQACELAVESTDSFILSHACATINNICTFVAQETEKNEIHKSLNGSNNEDSTSNDQQRRRSSSSKQAPATHWLMTYLTQFPNILPSLLVTILNLVLFDDTQDQWTLSRPLYVLMLLQKQYAVEYTSQVINQQLPERREFVTKALNTMTEGVDWTLTIKDRERFSQNVSAFRRELTMNNIVLIPVSLEQSITRTSDGIGNSTTTTTGNTLM